MVTEENMQIGYVYKLIDTRDNSIFYIGETYWRLKDRLAGHLNSKTPPAKRARIDAIKSAGLMPAIEAVETIKVPFIGADIVKVLREREKYWIQWHRDKGHMLLNYSQKDNPENLRRQLISLTRREQRLIQELEDVREKRLQLTTLLS